MKSAINFFSLLFLVYCSTTGANSEQASKAISLDEFTEILKGEKNDSWPAINPSQAVPVSEIKTVKHFFDVNKLTSENFWQHKLDCLGDGKKNPSESDISEFERISEDPTGMHSIREYGGMNTFLMVQDSGVCIKFTDKGYPIYPGEAFYWTIQPIKVDKEFGELLAKIAGYISSRGKASVLYDLGNKRFIADYYLKFSPLVIEYDLNPVGPDNIQRSRNTDFKYSPKHGLIVYTTNDRLIKQNPLIHLVTTDQLVSQEKLKIEKLVIK